MHQTLLPPDNATPLERLFSSVDDENENIGPVYELIPVADTTPPPKLLPWLIWQYGLGELSPYLPSGFDLIGKGIPWQRIRGTLGSISMGLSWLGYGGAIEEAPVWRRRWNLFQIELDRVRDRDLPDLQRIDGIVSLSPPERSEFVRGYRGYDVRAVVTSMCRTSQTIWSDFSGVSLPGVGARWSFGRQYEFVRSLSEAELTALGAWIPPVDEGGLWIDDDNLWVDENLLWAVPAAQARRNAISEAVSGQQPWLRFDDADGHPIGYRRAVIHPVVASEQGEYTISGSRWTSITQTPTALVLRATTGFGDGAGSVAASVSIVFGGGPMGGLKPGLSWLDPAQFSGGQALTGDAISIPFGLTVRERCTFLLTF